MLANPVQAWVIKHLKFYPLPPLTKHLFCTSRNQSHFKIICKPSKSVYLFCYKYLGFSEKQVYTGHQFKTAKVRMSKFGGIQPQILAFTSGG